ncbi:AGE family epimerase/isomerase [Poriferisphaera sp. WC338]|uniref:AGE family epimerase/isomerase n=1 Tax=Poriferisphaera sp. WC338 TaxID=3425129 RepID=UPI003D813A4F
MLFNHDEHTELLACYRDGLLENVLPFWLSHAIDKEYGGFLHSLNQNGDVIDTDKSLWIQCRFTWLLSTLYNKTDRNNDWLSAATNGIEFIEKYGFDEDGRVFFWVTRDGKPLRKRRYVYAEAFAAMAYSAYAKASGQQYYADKAKQIYECYIHYISTPNLLESKINTNVRPMRSLSEMMMGIVLGQTIRENLDYPDSTKWIDHCIDQLDSLFVNDQEQAVMECVSDDGEILDHFDGRLLNPGHAIETSWFILNESRYRNNDADLINLGTRMIDYMWPRGWDNEHGGIVQFCDVYNHPVQEYWHDMKFWWPQTDSIAALLTAYILTGNDKYKKWHRMTHDWAHEHFQDHEHGEWFGYLHRDGSISSTLKGNMWKGPFHLPRMQMYCWQMMEELSKEPVTI